METIIQAVSTIGFPIVIALVLVYYVKYLTDQNNVETKEMRLEHKEEVSKMTEALNNNTLAIQKLAERMGEKNI